MVDRRVALVCLSVVLSACGGDSESSGAGAGGASGGSGGSGNASGAGAGGSESFSVEISVKGVAPGYENTQCVVKRLGNTGPIRVNRFQNTISSSSHHLIVYKVADTEERTSPFNCVPFKDTLDPNRGAPLVISQKYDDRIELPAGAAYSLEPNQMVRLELHYINTKLEPVDVRAVSSFITIPAAEFQQEADFVLIGSLDVSVNASGTTTLGPIWFPLPQAYVDTNFFAITGHTHQFGTNVKVAIASDQAGPDTPVYDVLDWKWDEPETVKHDPPFQVPAAGGFRFSCEWNNTSGLARSIGESAEDEMCFFWGYYYPSRGAKVCFHSDNFGAFNVCCPDSPICPTILSFF
jgi:hypothetical protein